MDNKKTSPEQISKMREMRLNGKSFADIALACQCSPDFVSRHCKDIVVDLRKNRFVEMVNFKLQSPIKVYPFKKLSETDKKYYNECKPAVKETEIFITAKKEDYSKAVCFMDYRKGDMAWG